MVEEKPGALFACVALAMLCVVALSPLRLYAYTDDPQALVDATIEQLREQVTRDPVRIDEDPNHAVSVVEAAVMPHVDMRLTSRLVLGRHWRSASAAQRDAFVDCLRQLLIRLFAIHLGDYRDAEVKYSPTVFTGDRQQRATVRTQVSRAGSPEVSVDYRLYLTDNGWKVYDVAIFGISLVKTYHVTIDGDVQKHGLDSVIRQINAKVPLHGTGEGTRATAG